MTKLTKTNRMSQKLKEHLSILGQHLRLARLRRNLTMAQVAANAQCSRLTLSRLERGHATVSLGVLARVLQVLQLEDDLLLIAKDDKLGRLVQDLQLIDKKRASKNKGT